PAALDVNDVRAPSPEGITATTPPALPAADWRSIAMAIYGAIVGLLLVRLVVGQIALARLWRSSRPAPDWAERAFRQLAEPFCSRAQLRVSGRAVGPVCFGVFRPRVVVPAALLAAGGGLARPARFGPQRGPLSR